MLVMFLSGDLAVWILIGAMVAMLLLKFIKKKMYSVRMAKVCEYILLGLGHVMRGRVLKGFIALGIGLLIKKAYVVIASDLYDILKTNFNWRAMAFMVILHIVLFVIIKVSADALDPQKPSSSSSYGSGDDDRSWERDHMEYHHHDSHMP